MEFKYNNIYKGGNYILIMKVTIENTYLKKFELITPIFGGIRAPRWTLSTNTENIRINKFAIENEGLWDMKFVEIRAVKENGKIIVLIRFSRKKEELEGTFSISRYEDEKGNKSLNFSGRGIFRKFKIKAKDLTNEKSIILKPRVENIDGIKYFIIEIPLSN